MQRLVLLRLSLPHRYLQSLIISTHASIFPYPLSILSSLQDDEHAQKATFALVDMSTLTLCCDDLYDKEKVDIETLGLNDVYTLLQSTPAGLTDQEAVRRTEIFGPNKLEENQRSAFMHFI